MAATSRFPFCLLLGGPIYLSLLFHGSRNIFDLAVAAIALSEERPKERFLVKGTTLLTWVRLPVGAKELGKKS